MNNKNELFTTPIVFFIFNLKIFLKIYQKVQKEIPQVENSQLTTNENPFYSYIPSEYKPSIKKEKSFYEKVIEGSQFSFSQSLLNKSQSDSKNTKSNLIQVYLLYY